MIMLELFTEVAHIFIMELCIIVSSPIIIFEHFMLMVQAYFWKMPHSIIIQ